MWNLANYLNGFLHQSLLWDGIWSVRYKNLKNNSSGTSQRPEEGDPVLYRNADANAQLRQILNCIVPRSKYCTMGKPYAIKNNTEPRFTQLSLYCKLSPQCTLQSKLIFYMKHCCYAPTIYIRQLAKYINYTIYDSFASTASFMILSQALRHLWFFRKHCVIYDSFASTASWHRENP